MKKLIKRTIGSVADILLIMGFVVSCIILLNVADLVSKVENERKLSSLKNGYILMCEGSTNKEDESALKEKLLNFVDNNVSGNLYSMKSVHIHAQKDEVCRAYILFQKNDCFKLEIIDGGYDSECQNGVIIGESLKEYTVLEGKNRYIYRRK